MNEPIYERSPEVAFLAIQGALVSPTVRTREEGTISGHDSHGQIFLSLLEIE